MFDKGYNLLKRVVHSWLIVVFLVSIASGQEAETPATLPDREKLFTQFAETLNNAKLVGQFTIRGQDRPPSSEEYTIKSVKKLLDGDYWLFSARIKYGEHDVTLPLPLQVKWAGDTPIITLTEFTIPGMGTFSSRVVIYNQKYAGTWTHGRVGGHLFGVIQKLEETNAPE
jgi:hypothetical protein